MISQFVTKEFSLKEVMTNLCICMKFFQTLFLPNSLSNQKAEFEIRFINWRVKINKISAFKNHNQFRTWSSVLEENFKLELKNSKLDSKVTIWVSLHITHFRGNKRFWQVGTSKTPTTFFRLSLPWSKTMLLTDQGCIICVEDDRVMTHH